MTRWYLTWDQSGHETYYWASVKPGHLTAAANISATLTQNRVVTFNKLVIIVFHVIQIHLRQFHGTRYAAISPDMVNAEELDVQASHLSSTQDSDEDQWHQWPLPLLLWTVPTVPGSLLLNSLLQEEPEMWFSSQWNSAVNQQDTWEYFYLTDEAIFS